MAMYRYDATGNRISKTVGSQTTHYLYDHQHRVIAEAHNGQMTRHYVYSDHRLHSLIDQGKTYAVHTDWRGLPSRLTDGKGNKVWEQRFDAWGNELGESRHHALTVNHRLAGQYRDDETDLHYNVHRYLDSQAGRYISPDPLGTPDGPNRYAYLNGDPNKGIDPLGLFEIPEEAFLGHSLVYSKFSVPDKDRGHGDILRVAFAKYNQANGVRFSQAIIDAIIVNNYHSDANSDLGCYGIIGGIAGGGQCTSTNHFDNPNRSGPTGAGAPFEVEEYLDAATGKKAFRTTGEWRSTYTNSHWIHDAAKQIDDERFSYGSFFYQGNSPVDISATLNAFGRNSHALADFYAHTNWVDNRERGGCWVGPGRRSEGRYSV